MHTNKRPGKATFKALGVLSLSLTLFQPLGATANEKAAPISQEALVEDAVRTLILDRAQALSGHASVKVDASSVARFPACDDLTVNPPPGGKLRPRMSLRVQCDSPHKWATYVPAQSSVQAEYFVTARVIESGETLSPANLSTRMGDLLALPAGVVIDMTQILGATATRRIRQDEPLRANAVRPAGSVVRGQPVRVSAVGPGFVVASEGVALHDAARRAPVQVRMASGQVVTGVVSDKGSVEIRL